jgi:hypothetical protein
MFNLTSKRINELGLKIQGSTLEVFVNQLYQELETKGITFKPKCYLSDEWGCPHNSPVIAIPFYLADPELSRLEGEMTDTPAETPQEIMMYLRHEAGHAFNYAYRLYTLIQWNQIFGSFNLPYKGKYKIRPFHPAFVRHIPGWYAQKHPDEDFAETFAVLITPSSNWQTIYAKTPAFTKLTYVDKLIKEFGSKKPSLLKEEYDRPIETLNFTLAHWYQDNKTQEKTFPLPPLLDQDLKNLFSTNNPQQPASLYIQSQKKFLCRQINYWTGLDEEHIALIINSLKKRVQELKLTINTKETDELNIALTAFVTTLCINYLYTNSLIVYK